VVVTTYNNPRSLELCLLSLKNQSFKNFDVFIADDGSTDETRELLLRLKTELGFQIYHYWHPDVGYQKAQINNKVFRELNPERHPILVCLDHDVILHPRFIEDHYLVHEKQSFTPFLFMGRRVDLGRDLSEEITPQNLRHFTQGLNLSLLISAFRGQTRHALRSLRLAGPRWLLRLLKRDRVFDLLGSNFSLTTQVMLDVNGYNEDFKSYWGEDGDLFVRLRNLGIKRDGLSGYAVQWHLYHDRLTETEAHVIAYQALLEDHSYTICKNGIQKVPRTFL